MGVNKKIKSLNIVKKQIKMSEKFTFCNGDQFSFSTFSPEWEKTFITGRKNAFKRGEGEAEVVLFELLLGIIPDIT